MFLPLIHRYLQAIRTDIERAKFKRGTRAIRNVLHAKVGILVNRIYLIDFVILCTSVVAVIIEIVVSIERSSSSI